MAANPNQVQAQRRTPAEQRKLNEELDIQKAIEANYIENAARAARPNPQREKAENDADLKARLDSFRTARDLEAKRKKQEEEALKKVLEASKSVLSKADADLQNAIKESEALAKAEQEAEKAALTAYAQSKNAQAPILQVVVSAPEGVALQVIDGPYCDKKHLADTSGKPVVQFDSAPVIAKGSAFAGVASVPAAASSRFMLGDQKDVVEGHQLNAAAQQPQPAPMLNQFHLAQEKLQDQLKKEIEKQAQLRRDMEEARKSANARKAAAATASAAAMVIKKKKMVIRKGVITFE